MEKLSYSVMEAAKLIGISKSNLYRLINQGEIPFIRLGKRILIPKKKFEDLFDCLNDKI